MNTSFMETKSRETLIRLFLIHAVYGPEHINKLSILRYKELGIRASSISRKVTGLIHDKLIAIST
jgi:hypothetical protein